MSEPNSKPIDPVDPNAPPAEPTITPITKPAGDPLARFLSKRPTNAGGVETLLEALPHFTVPDARDFVRLHAHEAEYWSGELCFVDVPIIGQRKNTLHLIDEDIARAHLPGGKIQRFRLTLASKPFDVFFLAHVPTTSLDNAWNLSALRGCEQARTRWVQLISRKAEGVEGYRIENARDADAFPEPRWPAQSLGELIVMAFSPDRMIDRADHPALLRLIGAKQPLA